MVVLHRLLILFGAASALGAVLLKFGFAGLGMVATASAWLRFSEFLMLFAIALMLEQIVSLLRAKKPA